MDKQSEQAVVTEAVVDTLMVDQTVWEGDKFDFTITEQVRQEWEAYKERKEEAYLQRGRYKVKAIAYLEENWPPFRKKNLEPSDAVFGEGSWGSGVEDFMGRITYNRSDGISYSSCEFYLYPEAERMEITSDLGTYTVMERWARMARL